MLLSIKKKKKYKNRNRKNEENMIEKQLGKLESENDA